MAEPITLYDHIAANNRKTFLLVLLFPLSLCLLVGLACIAGVYVIGDPAFTRDGITVFLTFFPGMHVYLLRMVRQAVLEIGDVLHCGT